MALVAADQTEMRFLARNVAFDNLKSEAVVFMQLLDRNLLKLDKAAAAVGKSLSSSAT
eukprot:CAMPEP_0170464474 /NCGR_PEP_ID=MMETSP0123-20130129/9190_1 /TAXON_ID=182087 /ORGANISM="Favella ehrenbergii, Strain Fehren 1" /LENGTH=57 /DNA_ID=CAMNT_0010730151 /DNA_START=234 /DNA_END=407 /DNA_ORIENTATION=+